MYVCMHIYMYIYVYIVYTYIYIYIYVYIHMCDIYIYMYYAYMYVYMHMCVCLWARTTFAHNFSRRTVCLCVRVCDHAHVRVLIFLDLFFVSLCNVHVGPCVRRCGVIHTFYTCTGVCLF